MRKKNKEIAPAPVETDFYTEALKAFDVVMPPSEEELEAMRQAEAEKANKRKMMLRRAILAVMAVFILVLALWRPWENGSGPPVLGEPGVSSPFSDPIKISFRVYDRPGDTDPSDAARIDLWEYYGGQAESLIKQLELLDWIHMPSISFSPAPAIGDLVIDRGDGEKQISFNADGLLFAEGYMARPDNDLWNDMMSLLVEMSQSTETGRYFARLMDGSDLYLDVNRDGSFLVLKDQGIVHHGYWSRIDTYLLLYTADPKVGICIFQVQNDGGLAYLDEHTFWLLRELKGLPALYPSASAVQNVASMKLELSTEFGTHEGAAQLTQAQYQQLIALLEQAQWIDMSTSGYMPTFCGSVTITSTQEQGLTETLSLRFTHMGLIYDGLRYSSLSDEAWMEFVKILSFAGEQEMNFRTYARTNEEDSLVLMFVMDGRFSCNQAGNVSSGNYLQLGNLVLLAGTNGCRDIFFWDRDNDKMITRSGEMLDPVPIIYG